MSEQKQYAERDIVALDEAGHYYITHVSAMTGEGLHMKSDIAAELAWRDYQIDLAAGRERELQNAVARANDRFLDMNRIAAEREQKLRRFVEFVAESHDAGRHDGQPEPCPAHDDAVLLWAEARSLLREIDGHEHNEGES